MNTLVLNFRQKSTQLNKNSAKQTRIVEYNILIKMALLLESENSIMLMSKNQGVASLLSIRRYSKRYT